MSPNFDKHLWDSCRKYICTGKEKSKSSDTHFLGFSGNCSDLSSISNTCAGAAPKPDGSAYNRRKLHGNTVALLSEENKNSTKLSPHKYTFSTVDNHFTENKDDGNLLISRQHCLSSPVELVPNCIPNDTCVIGEDTVSVKASNNDLEKCAKKHAASLNDSCSSTKDTAECSSAPLNMKRDSSGVIKEPFGGPTSAKELCIYVLKSHGLLGGERNPRAYPSELPCSNVSTPLEPCKVCGCFEDPSQILICDLCDQAFHPSCCNPKVKVKELLDDDWYCQSCVRKKPKPLLQTSTGRSVGTKKGKYGSREPYGVLISSMLKDTEPYCSDVRIGGNFQAEVPDWSASSSIDNDYFGELSQMDLTKLDARPEVWKYKKSKSVGNWIQCQDVIGTDENGQAIICGKWRRAPLFIKQNDNWDCSCAVKWDPVHADCEVPQELPTSEVRKQLRFVEKVTARLAAGKLQDAKNPWPKPESEPKPPS